MCNCIENVEKMLNENLLEQCPNAEIVEPIALQNKGWTFGEGLGERLFIPAIGRYMDGKRKRKADMNMYFTYCPFCGEKVKE